MKKTAPKTLSEDVIMVNKYIWTCCLNVFWEPYKLSTTRQTQQQPNDTEGGFGTDEKWKRGIS